MRVPKFLLPAPKNWILGPKTAKFGPKLAFWAKFIWCPVGGLPGGCGAGFISQDTYLLYDKDSLGIKKKIDVECFQDFDVNLEN